MPDIFFTSTFRNDWNKSLNMRLVGYLENSGMTCFLPQRDACQSGDRRATFRDDIKGLDASNALLAIGAKTQTANWGLEIGYAYALGKPVFILTDKDHPIELMPEGAAREILIVDDLDDLEAYGPALKNLVSQH